jgi:hypothetical protein
VCRDELGRPVERVSVDIGFGFPVEIRRLLDRVVSACEGGTTSDQYAAFFSLAAALLCRTHDVSLTTACDLLAVPEDELPLLVGAVMAIVSAGPQATGQRSDGGPTP